MEGLTTGRIVHFDSRSKCRAAVVTQVWNDQGVVNLYVLPDGLQEAGGVETSIAHQDSGAQNGQSWHWPEQV